jgi:tRNA nucleotidyltransferase (CCA-adding enzyme)
MTTDNSSWIKIQRKVLAVIIPKREEIERVEKAASKIVDELSSALSKEGIQANVEIHGSVARGTWLAGERDFDIFIILDNTYTRKDLPRILDITKAYLGKSWVEAYAEHPYLIADINDFRVEFVPCFHVDPLKGLISATDRTPLHTEFVINHLSDEGKNEVRLLKRFMKGTNVYGAEVKVGGFSGYLCELLIIAYSSFKGVLEAATRWSDSYIIDIKRDSEVLDLRKRFTSSLIVPDPIDPLRNVGSPVSVKKFWEFSAAARAFLKKPSFHFFYPKKIDVDTKELLKKISLHEYDLVFLVVKDGDVVVPDVLWGQLIKSEKALVAALEDIGFNIVRNAVWSDEFSKHIFILELKSASIPSFIKRMGPPVRLVEDSNRFLKTHKDSDSTIAGPWIEGNRWWIITQRQVSQATSALEMFLDDNGRGIGVSRGIAEKISQNYKILQGVEVEEVLASHFSEFLDSFLKGRPGWLE